jgi:hypothetical protein
MLSLVQLEKNETPFEAVTLRILQGLQTRGARAIFEAFRANSKAALDVETRLLPVVHQIQKHNTYPLNCILSYQTDPRTRR